MKYVNNKILRGIWCLSKKLCNFFDFLKEYADIAYFGATLVISLIMFIGLLITHSVYWCGMCLYVVCIYTTVYASLCFVASPLIHKFTHKLNCYYINLYLECKKNNRLARKRQLGLS